MADYTVSLNDNQEAILAYLGATPQALVDQKLQDYVGAYNEAKEKEDFKLYQEVKNADPETVAATIEQGRQLKEAQATIDASMKNEPLKEGL
jgi:hypothetical protein